MSQDGAQRGQSAAAPGNAAATPTHFTAEVYLDDSLSMIYEKLAHKFQTELSKSNTTLS